MGIRELDIRWRVPGNAPADCPRQIPCLVNPMNARQVDEFVVIHPERRHTTPGARMADFIFNAMGVLLIVDAFVACHGDIWRGKLVMPPGAPEKIVDAPPLVHGAFTLSPSGWNVFRFEWDSNLDMAWNGGTRVKAASDFLRQTHAWQRATSGMAPDAVTWSAR